MYILQCFLITQFHTKTTFLDCVSLFALRVIFVSHPDLNPYCKARASPTILRAISSASKPACFCFSVSWCSPPGGKCEHCDQEASFMCSACQLSHYCSSYCQVHSIGVSTVVRRPVSWAPPVSCPTTAAPTVRYRLSKCGQEASFLGSAC